MRKRYYLLLDGCIKEHGVVNEKGFLLGNGGFNPKVKLCKAIPYGVTRRLVPWAGLKKMLDKTNQPMLISPRIRGESGRAYPTWRSAHDIVPVVPPIKGLNYGAGRWRLDGRVVPARLVEAALELAERIPLFSDWISSAFLKSRGIVSDEQPPSTMIMVEPRLAVMTLPTVAFTPQMTVFVFRRKMGKWEAQVLRELFEPISCSLKGNALLVFGKRKDGEPIVYALNLKSGRERLLPETVAHLAI